MKLLDAIPVGREHALTKAQIAALLGASTRDVEHGIEELRKSSRAGICSDSQVGYWRPRSAAEFADNSERRRRRALSQLVTVRGERRYLRSWPSDVVPLTFQWEAA